MRNLVALERRATALRPQEAREDVADAECTFAVDRGDQRAFFLGASGRIDVLDLSDSEADQTTDELVDLGEALPDARAGDAKWRWVHYVTELDALVCACTDGALATVDVEARFADEIGSLDGGIRALAWSSDQEKLAMVTGVGTLVVMNQQWDVLHEVQWEALLPSGVRRAAQEEAQCVELCWREDGRFLAMNAPTVDDNAAAGSSTQQKVLVFTDELELHAVGRLEDGRPIPALGRALHWSPNQSLLASSEARNDRLWVVFFERNGLRHGEFQLPSEFSRLNDWDVARVEWNADSDVLAVHLRTGRDAHSVIQLWTRGNYHWYLKQERRWPNNELIGFEWDDESSGKLYFLTHQASPQSVATADGDLAPLTLVQEEFTWDITSVERQTPLSSSAGEISAADESKSLKSVAVTGVIDGCKLLLTPLHQALVPPPFALRTVELSASVNSVAFDARSETLLCLSSTRELYVVRDYLSPNPAVVMLKTSSDSDLDLSSLLWASYDPQSHRLAFAAKSGWFDALLLGLCVVGDGSEDPVVTTTQVDGVTGIRRACAVLVASGMSRSDQGQNQHGVNDDNSPPSSPLMALQCHNGDVYSLSVGEDSPEFTCPAPHRVAQSLPAYSHLAVVQSNTHASEAMTIIGLQQRNARLFVGARALVSGCSSFRLCPVSSTLLCTTVGSEAELRMLPLAAVVHAGDSSLANSPPGHQIPLEARKIEQGARLVAVIGDRAGVVLQMPRGNLECVSPRLLVLALVLASIRRHSIAAALELCRTHRLDMNLLVDFDREGFLASFNACLLRELIESRPARVVSDRLCLFVTNLHPVDVWRDKYEPQFRAFGPPVASSDVKDEQTRGSSDSDGNDKVNAVCVALMHAIRSRLEHVHTSEQGEAGEVDALLLPYLTCAVKHSPPQFVEALTKIQELSSGQIGPKHQQRQRAALKHLVLLTHADTLFDEALGMYDLPLVRQVAAFSDRDPRSYAPLLDELAAIRDLNERKLRIDMHLERFDRALAHLSVLVRDAIASGRSSDELSALEERVESLVARGSLYSLALGLFRDLPDLRRRLTLLHGQHLEAEKKFTDAAYVYLSVSAASDAQRAFALARQWQMALSLAIRAQQSREQVRQLAYQIAEDMLSHQSSPKDITEIAQVYAEYCGDLDEAVALLVTHKQWREAMRLALLHERGDLVETDVEPGVLQCHEELVEELQKQEAAYIKNWRRLDAIQTQKRLFKMYGIDGKRWNHGQDDDAESDVRSLVSSAASSALSSASMSSVGSHNSARSIGNFSMQSLASATSSHFYATQALQQQGGDAAVPGKSKGKNKGGMPSRRERRNRMKQGGAEEEAYVAQQLTELQPSGALRREVKELLEMLVLFGHTDRAQKLQTQLTAFERRVDVENPPPSATPTSPKAESDESAKTEQIVAPTSSWRLEALAPFTATGLQE